MPCCPRLSRRPPSVCCPLLSYVVVKPSPTCCPLSSSGPSSSVRLLSFVVPCCRQTLTDLLPLVLLRPFVFSQIVVLCCPCCRQTLTDLLSLVLLRPFVFRPIVVLCCPCCRQTLTDLLSIVFLRPFVFRPIVVLCCPCCRKTLTDLLSIVFLRLFVFRPIVVLCCPCCRQIMYERCPRGANPYRRLGKTRRRFRDNPFEGRAVWRNFATSIKDNSPAERFINSMSNNSKTQAL